MITRFQVRSTIVWFGPGAVQQTGMFVKEKGAKKVLLISGKVTKKAGITAKVIDSLAAAGIEVTTYDGVVPDVPEKMVNEAAAFAKAEKVEAIIGVGGGSAMDAAKAVNVLMGNDPPISNYMKGMSNPPKKLGLPLILIPTTAGTGSELTMISVVSEDSTNLKKGVVGPACAVTAAIIDPELNAGMSPSLTAVSGLDAFSHALEAYTSKLRNPMSDILAEKAMDLILTNLPLAVKNGDDIDVRSNMCLAALIAGAAFSDAVIHIGHSIAHTLGAKYHISHGIGCAIALPIIIEYVSDTVPEKVRGIGQRMGLSLAPDMKPDELGKAVAQAIRDFSKSVGVPGFQEATGQGPIDDETFDWMADVALADTCTIMTPKKPSKEDMIALLREACK